MGPYLSEGLHPRRGAGCRGVGGDETQRTVGLALIAFSMGMYVASLYLAYAGRVVAGLLGGTLASVSLIVGADLLKGA